MPRFRYLAPYCLIIICLVRCTPSLAQDVTEEWARWYDHQGPGDVYFEASVRDEEGNLYITSTSFPAPAFKLGTYTEHREILTVKYTPSGEVVWSTRFVADDMQSIFEYTNEARALALDGSGGIYVAGVRQRGSPPYAEAQYIILIKLNAENGEQVWFSEYTDGNEGTEVKAITADSFGGVYLTGANKASTLSQDYLTLKYSSTSGDLLWSRVYEGVGAGHDVASAIAVDNKGGVIVTGKSYSKVVSFPGHGPGRNVYDVATIKYDADNGQELWKAAYTGDTIFRLSGPRGEFAHLNAFLALDDVGDVYVTAKYNSIVENDGISHGVVTVKYNNERGEQVWDAKYASNTVADPAIALDRNGGVYVAGRYREHNLFNKLFTVKYNAADGELLWEGIYPYLADTIIDGDLSRPIIKVGATDDVFLTGTIRPGELMGLVTMRINSMHGNLIWKELYLDDLAVTGFYPNNLAIPHFSLEVDNAGNPVVMGSAYVIDTPDDYSETKNSNLFLLKYSIADGAVIFEKSHEALNSTHDFVVASTVDEDGNTYVAGVSQSAGAGNNIAIIKYSKTGELLWVRHFDGGTGDRPEAIVLDKVGDVYVTGSTGMEIAPDYLTLKLRNSDGAIVWQSLYDSGDKYYDAAIAIAVDEADGVYVTGASFKTTSGSDYATLKYNAMNGEQVWVERYDGGFNFGDGATAIGVDNKGGVYVTGESSNGLMGYDGYDFKDFATVKYGAPDGNQLWVSRYDGTYGYDAPIALAIDIEGGVYVTGISIGEFNEDIATVKYDPVDGNEIWSSRYVTQDAENVKAIAVDNTGGVFITGFSFTFSDDLERYANFVTIKYETTGGEQAWIRTYGSDQSDSRAYDIATDGTGGVYVTGQSITGAESEKTGTAATLRYKATDGALEWEILKEGVDEEGRTVGLDQEGNVYVSGSSFSNSTYGDFLTIKYSQGSICNPVVAKPIVGAAVVRTGTQNSAYTLTGTGATLYDWAVSGERSISILGQGSEQIRVDWPSEAGVYEVGVSYSSGEACTANDTTLTVAVYDPDAGFVIGAGWFDSPVNPALPHMQVGGRVHFAFASWYAKDARTVPGYTAIRLSSGGFDFRSAAHTPMRLVISGDIANYTGRGTVNGQEGYGFLVAAVDGGAGQDRQQDRVRLKVWELGTGRVVYDNQPGAGEGAVASTVIDGGQIVIHRPLGRSLEQLTALAEATSQGLAPAPHHLQAFPTVFSSQATVTFALDQDGEYTLDLYDLNGTRMREIGRGSAQAGRLQDFLVDSSGLSENLYFLRLVTGYGVQTVKLVLRR